MAKGYSDGKEEGPIEVIGLSVAMVFILIVMAWIAGSRSIVATFAPMFLSIGKLWQYIPLPGDLGTLLAARIYGDAARFIAAPAEVGLMEWTAFVNFSIGPLILFLVLATIGAIVWIMKRPSPQVYRKFSNADSLMRELSHIFTGTAPILHLRKELAQHKDPRWARQRWPEDVLLQDAVGGKRLVTGSRRDPSSLRLHMDRVQAWLEGFDEVRTESEDGSVKPLHRPSGSPQIGRHADGKWVSHTLGVLAVRLADPGDRAQFRKMPAESGFSFADRFTPVGRVMFAVMCAQAFGGKEGTDDWFRARDQLNNSCRGARHGLPNLSVVDWLYEKYRTNELAHKLFAIHQWEYTYLFELFAQAKRNGKMPDSEFRWLKPADRMMWYALNTVGRYTPHTESGAVFTMHAFERGWARRKRWPLRLTEGGKLEPSVVVLCSTEALQLEFQRYVDGEDESGNEWWKDNHQWLSSSPNIASALAPAAVPRKDDEAAAQMQVTEFDRMMSGAAAPDSSMAALARGMAAGRNAGSAAKGGLMGPAGFGGGGNDFEDFLK